MNKFNNVIKYWLNGIEAYIIPNIKLFKEMEKVNYFSKTR